MMPPSRFVIEVGESGVGLQHRVVNEPVGSKGARSTVR